MNLKGLLPSDFYFYKVTYKDQKAPQYFRIPFTIAQTNESAESYIDSQSHGKLIERKQAIPYKTFIEEYLKPEGLWIGD
jgi:hypothetical protein